MHSLALAILADSDNPGKPVFIAIVIAIWIIGSIVSSIRKATSSKRIQDEKVKMRATRRAMQLPAVAQNQPKRPPPKAPLSRKLVKRRPPPLPAKAPAPPPRQRAPIMMQPAEPAPPRQPNNAAARPAPVRTATAAALNRWLSPTTMRQQFILTELLQPPITMRDNHLL